MRTILNVLAFQAGWFASVMGAARGLPWLGPLAVMLVLACHFIQSPARLAEATLVAATGVFGFIFDTALIADGVFSPVRYGMPAPLSPLWMIVLWLNLATILNVSLKWLHGRYLLAALLGAVGGPAAYYAGARLGAAQEAIGMGSILVLSLAWGFAVPALFHVAKIIDTGMHSYPLPRGFG